jgi:hypothetical protein
VHGAVVSLDGHRLGQLEHIPDLVHPRPDRDHDLLAFDGAALGDDRAHGVGIVPGLEARHLETG